MANKRSSSPPEQWRNDKRTCKDMDHIQLIVDRSVAKQMKNIEKHVFIDRQCQELKEKHEKVDKNCLNWHDFALDMQQRVKRLAVILNRQQESIKSLKLENKVETADASVQTDDLPLLPPLGVLLSSKPTESVPKSEPLTSKEGIADVSKLKQPKHSHPPAFIDLTGNDDDCEQTSKPLAQIDMKDIKKESHSKLCLHHSVKTASNIKHKFETVNTGDLPSSCNAATTLGQGSSTSKSHSTHIQSNRTDTSTTPMDFSCTSTLYPSLPLTPLPPKSVPKGVLPPPFQPDLKLRKSDEGLELSWDHNNVSKYAKIECYEIYVYQHNPSYTNHSNRWKKIKSDPIIAIPLPMACTLSQYSAISTYYFAVRGKDVYGRYGNFSTPCCSKSLE